MRDTSISRRRRTKLKLLVSFNGSLRRRPSPRKLRYVGGENHIVSVERNTSLQKLKSKIADLICPNANFSQLRLKYHVLKSFCGDDGEEEEPVLGLLESDDDLRCMIEEYETMELKGKLHSTRFWVFVCNANDGFDDGALVDKHVLNVNCSSNWFCEKTNGFGKPLSDGSDGDEKDENEKLSVVSNKYESKAKKLGDDFLRKMVLKKQLLVKNLDGSPSFRSGREQRDAELVSENDVCQSSPKQLGSELRSSLNSEPRNPNFGGHPFPENELNCKPTNGYIVASESSGKISPVAESNSGPLNAKDGNLPTRDKGSNDGFLRQSPMISGYGNGRCMLSSNQFDAPEKSSNVSCSSSLNWPVNELDPNCEFTSADFALSNRENIIPQHRDSNMVKKGLALPTCRDPLMSGICSMESSQRTESQQRGYGCSNCNHRCCLSEARNQRIYQYQIRYQSNVNELGSHKHFRLDYAGLRSSSNIAQQETPSRSQSATLTKPLSGSHYYEIQQDQGYIDHGDMFNPPYPGEENVLGPVGLGVPENVKAKFGDRHVADAGNDKFFLPLDADGNPLLGARAVEAGIDLLTSLGTEKIDLAGQLLGENSLHIVGVDGQTPLDYIEEPLPKNQGEVLNLSNSPGNPCDYIITELSGDNNLLDVKGVNETLSMFQGGAKGLKNNGASIDLSLLNLYSESSGKVHLPVSSATRDTFESFLKPLSDGLDLMDEEHINSGPKFEKSRDNSSDSSSNNVLKCKKDDDKGEASQQNPKSNSSTAGKDKNEKTSSCLKLNNGIPTDITTIYSHLAIRELQIIKSADLEYVKELGRGTYGTVYYGKWKGSDVAIKKIKPSCFTDGAKEEDRLVADFWKEAHTLGQLHHPNIVALYGVVTDGPVNCLATVTEYMVNGSLKQVLRRKDRTIDRRKRLIIAMDAAFGMEYLHGKNIVHFDLKSHNFLVNMKDPQRPICKIGDLGLSKIKQRTLVSGGIRGTIPWMAPELLSGRDLVSEKVDVFSFGIVMWELLTGEEPYGNMRSEEIIAGIIRGNLRPEIPSWCDPAWRSLMESCWSPNPDCRPSFSEISKQLRTMAASLNIK